MAGIFSRTKADRRQSQHVTYAYVHADPHPRLTVIVMGIADIAYTAASLHKCVLPPITLTIMAMAVVIDSSRIMWQQPIILRLASQ
jgi:hypothetical protein